jgi:hypothetical protein
MKSSALEFGDVVREVIGLDPIRQAVWRLAVEAAGRNERPPTSCAGGSIIGGWRLPLL